MDPSQTARKRAEIIMKVNCGLMTASDAARELNISRKTYYQWEKKGLAALLGSVTSRRAGRPETESDRERQTLEKKLDNALQQNAVLHRKMVLKDILSEMKSGRADRDKKK